MSLPCYFRPERWKPAWSAQTPAVDVYLKPNRPVVPGIGGDCHGLRRVSLVTSPARKLITVYRHQDFGLVLVFYDQHHNRSERWFRLGPVDRVKAVIPCEPHRAPDSHCCAELFTLQIISWRQPFVILFSAANTGAKGGSALEEFASPYRRQRMSIRVRSHEKPCHGLPVGEDPEPLTAT